MVVGESKVTNTVLRMLGRDTIYEIDNYVNKVCFRDFIVMKSIEQVKSIFGESLENFLSCLTEDEFMYLRSYTGYNFRNINSILRGNWSYEINGILNNETEVRFRNDAKVISGLLDKFEMPKINFMTFRGVTFDYFSNYGISELSQLKTLLGKYLYEQGFTSTSMLKETCYFNQKDMFKNYNVEIRYLIPSESNDGALLMDSNISYSANQNEFLLNAGSLSKVIDVKVDESSNTASLTVVLVPKKIYEKTYVSSKKM